MALYRGISREDGPDISPAPSPGPGATGFVRPSDYQASADEWNPYEDSSNDLVALYQYSNGPAGGSPKPPYTPITRAPRSRKKFYFVGVVILGLLIIAAAVTIPLLLIHHHSSSSSDSSSNGPGKPKNSGATSGKNGSTIFADDGTTFTYINNFGGEWVADPTQPFANGGKAQSWSPSVGGEDWVWGTDIARGVNLGGWLVTEPFISPSLFEKYINTSSTPIVDEWTLSIAMGSNLASEMENHYATFITEEDFAAIAGAGLNFVRIPIGFWAIETMGEEPFLVGTSWKYFLKAIEWARKYGIRIFLDLHALPGSQNGWNHSGKAGTVNFMNGVMGIANAERTLTYLRILVEFVSQEQYREVVPVVGIVNEILWATIGQVGVQSFYLAAYDAIRTSTTNHIDDVTSNNLFVLGTGAGAGPYIAIHEGFQGPALWAGFLAGADRIALDQHPYLAFTGDNTDPPDVMALKPCQWAIATNQSSTVFGVTLGGEFSSALNDCGLWLNGIGSTPSSPNCDLYDNWASWNQTFITSLKQVTLASMDALQNSFFWTWKIGNSTVLGTSSCPLWHYQLGLEQGWIPADPREAIGHCGSVLSSSQVFDGNYPATATGGAGAGTISPAQVTSHVFPPPTLAPSFTGTQIALLPTYTPTGTVKTLFAPTFTAAPSAAVGDGWNNTADTQLAYVPVQGCTYPDPWNAVNATLPTATCV